jgi:Phosphoesterase family
MASATRPPGYAHIVVVVEENHALSQIIGDPAAPYINSLAAGGALLANYHAVAHPSQPNYFALYAGSTFGVADSGDHQEPDPTLATILQDHGGSFTGYAETGSPRRHNPWESFPEGFSVEKNFSAFPASDLSALPDVAFVIPNLDDDMHDGTVAAGDAWLQTNLGAYAQWALAHNSLLVVTWDEDDSGSDNLIPTILYGAHINVGNYSASYTHYNLLSTLLSTFDLAGPNNAAGAPSIDVFARPAPGNAQVSSAPGLGARSPVYQIAGVGDFNHDGASDVLWRNATTGQLDEWRLVNGQWSRSLDLGSHGADWQVAGIGDFNHDGAQDILFRNASTGQVDEWRMLGGQWNGSIGLGSHGTDWQVAGIGDFDRDGTSDVLWRNSSTGQVDEWRLSNGQWAGSIGLGTHGTGWQVAGIGDFNHDGADDILWRNSTTGQVDEWRMLGGQWNGSIGLGARGPDWQIAAVNDFNADGTSDVLWRNSVTGLIDLWAMRDGQWSSSQAFSGALSGYQIGGTGDFNHDGSGDLLWRNPATGQTHEWLLVPA